MLLCFHYCTVLCFVLQQHRHPTFVGFLKPVMALRQTQGIRAAPDHSQNISSLPEQTGKHSRDRGDLKKPHSSNTENQSSKPIPASFCPTDGSVSGEVLERGDSPIHHDSMEEDSLSEYDNVRSEEEEEQDYEEDEELHTDADGMNYYIHCCPEDESYLEGMDCHEGAESINRPSTSKEADVRGNTRDAWEFPEGFYEELQQDTEELVHKCPEPITESTFIQAPMAENEEDEEEDADEVEEEEGDDDDYGDDNDNYDHAVEKDATYSVHDQVKAGGNQDGMIWKGQCDLQEDSKNRHQGLNYSKAIKGEEDLSKDYGRSKRVPQKCKGDAQRSFINHREGNKKSNFEATVDKSGNCDVRRPDNISKQGSLFRGDQICKEDKGSRSCRHNGMTKPEDNENKEDFRKRHSYRDHVREKRDDKCLHVSNDSLEDCMGKGQECHHNYRAKTRRNREQYMDTDEKMDQVVNEVRTKMKVGPQSTGTDRGIAEKSCDERRISGNLQVPVQRPQSEESRPSAPNTPMQPLDSQLQKDLTKPMKEDCLRSNQSQVTFQFN